MFLSLLFPPPSLSKMNKYILGDDKKNQQSFDIKPTFPVATVGATLEGAWLFWLLQTLPLAGTYTWPDTLNCDTCLVPVGS